MHAIPTDKCAIFMHHRSHIYNVLFLCNLVLTCVYPVCVQHSSHFVQHSSYTICETFVYYSSNYVQHIFYLIMSTFVDLIQIMCSISLTGPLKTRNHKCVLLQTVKTQMKCSIMQHFTRVCTVCLDQIDLQRKKYILRYNL